MIRKLTIGVPSHLIQRGIACLKSRLLTNSEAAPIGQSSPHQLRPVKITDRNTSGNQSPHMT